MLRAGHKLRREKKFDQERGMWDAGKPKKGNIKYIIAVLSSWGWRRACPWLPSHAQGPSPPHAPRPLRSRVERDCTIVAWTHCGCCWIRSRVNTVVTSQTLQTPAHYLLLLRPSFYTLTTKTCTHTCALCTQGFWSAGLMFSFGLPGMAAQPMRTR